MQYALLIYSDESTDPQPGTPEFDAFFKGYEDFTKEVQEKGLMKGGDALQRRGADRSGFGAGFGALWSQRGQWGNAYRHQIPL